MKKFILLILLIPTLYFTQNSKATIVFSDLIKLYQNDYEFAAKILEKKGFSFNNTTESDFGEGVLWKFNGNKFIFLAKYCFDSNCGRINIQTDNAKLYKLLKSQAINYGFKYGFTERSKELNTVFSSFVYKDFVLTIGEGTKNDQPFYSISLDKNIN